MYKLPSHTFVTVDSFSTFFISEECSKNSNVTDVLRRNDFFNLSQSFWKPCEVYNTTNFPKIYVIHNTLCLKKNYIKLQYLVISRSQAYLYVVTDVHFFCYGRTSPNVTDVHYKQAWIRVNKIMETIKTVLYST